MPTFPLLSVQNIIVFGMIILYTMSLLNSIVLGFLFFYFIYIFVEFLAFYIETIMVPAHMDNFTFSFLSFIYTGWSKSRFIVVHMENIIIINNNTKTNCVSYPQL